MVLLLSYTKEGINNVINEDQKIQFQKSLTAYAANGYVSYSGVAYTGTVFRDNDSFDSEDPFICITWLPSGKKQKYVSTVTSKRDNTLYHNYGYTESEMCVLSSFAEDTSGMRGRRLADSWLRSLETYIKNNWNNTINGIGVILDSFTTYREVPDFFSERLYGLETRFEMQSHNVWTDEPVSGATDMTDISGFTAKVYPENSVTGMINVWVT